MTLQLEFNRMSFFYSGCMSIILLLSSCRSDVETGPQCFPENYTVEFENLLSTAVQITLFYDDGYIDSIEIDPNSAKSRIFDFYNYGIIMDIGGGGVEPKYLSEIELSSDNGLIRTDTRKIRFQNGSPYKIESYYGGKEAIESITNPKKCSETFTLVFPIDSCYFDYSCPEIN